MKPVMIIRDPESFQLVADETRRKIIFLLRVKEMNVGQIAAELNLTPQAVYHHIRRLVNSRMVEITREERVGHLIESYYRATAEAFIFSVGNVAESSKLLKEELVTILAALKRIGFELEYDDAKISELADSWQKIKDCCDAAGIEDAVAKLDDIDFLTQQTLMEFAQILSMSDKEFEEQQENKQAFRRLLQSALKA